MNQPLVSVLIDTYNHEPFIERAVSSVLEQDFPASEREILVVDDGSTDRTREILRKFEPAVRVLSKANGGQGSAFNCGIPECRGKIVAFLDGDDWWLPRKLARVTELMQKDPSLGVIGHGFFQVSDGPLEHPVVPGRGLRFRLDSRAAAELFRLNRSYLGTSRLTLRVDVARQILPVPESLLFEADEYLFTVGPVLANALILPEALTCYRAHGSNLFLSSGGNRTGERKKQKVLAALCTGLRNVFERLQVAPEVSQSILEIVELEAAQLRLSLDGGSPWETFHTETALYRIQHTGASSRSRVFRALSMVPALVLPPRWFYAGRRWLGTHSWYRQTRDKMIPVPPVVAPDPENPVREPK